MHRFLAILLLLIALALYLDWRRRNSGPWDDGDDDDDDPEGPVGPAGEGEGRSVSDRTDEPVDGV